MITTTWGREINDIKNLSIWLEQWAKAGAGPGYRINDPLVYIQNLNWLGNWIERYFLENLLIKLVYYFHAINCNHFIYKAKI